MIRVAVIGRIGVPFLFIVVAILIIVILLSVRAVIISFLVLTLVLVLVLVAILLVAVIIVSFFIRLDTFPLEKVRISLKKRVRSEVKLASNTYR